MDLFLLDCPTYDDYLDTFVTRSDIRYVRNVRLCRMLVELGYRSSTEIYTPEQFEAHKLAAYETLWPTIKATVFFSENIKTKDPVLLQLAQRERPNVQKMISTIIFMKYRLPSGFEISGYIDYENSLRRAATKTKNAADWQGIFEERVMLKPRPHHLSYYDWHKGHVCYNNSDNYLVLHDVEYGLIFMHRGDHKKVCVDVSKDYYSQNCTRAMHFSEKYGYVVFYDHVVRKKI